MPDGHRLQVVTRCDHMTTTTCGIMVLGRVWHGDLEKPWHVLACADE
jgi:hypothetical protein